MGSVSVICVCPVVAHMVTLCCSTNALTICVYTLCCCGNHFIAIFADYVVSSVSIINVLPVVLHMIATRLYMPARTALAIYIYALCRCSYYCLTVCTNYFMGSVSIVYVLPVVTHVVTFRTTNACFSIFPYTHCILLNNFTIYPADNIMSSIMVVHIFQACPMIMLFCLFRLCGTTRTLGIFIPLPCTIYICL